VFVRTEGDLHAATPILLLHGFPTSSHDFVKVWPRLAKKHPLIALDFVGFGMSDKPATFGYGLFEQADVVLEVLQKLDVARVHIVAHDMGTSVATELCARRERGLLPIEMASLTLTNGSVFIELAHLAPAQHLLRAPKLGPIFARFASYTLFRRSMRKLFAEPDSVEESELREMWTLMSRDDGSARMAQIIDYIEQRHRYGRRWIGALERLDVPSLVLWGAHDPVAVLAIGERLGKTIPGTRLRVLRDLGHYPHVEGPDSFAAELLSFLAEL
jgi:pimeloyl-ACP methyl ester carboxylesterase